MSMHLPVRHLDHTAPTVGSALSAPGGAAPISIAPGEHPALEASIRAAGGTVSPLGPETRGLVWMLPRTGGDLDRTVAAHPELQWVQLPMAGVDAHRELLASDAGTGRVWTSAKGAYSEPVAEHALALTLATMRYVPEKSRATQWEQLRRGTSLYGRHVLVVGAGGIAMEYLRLIEPFRPEVTVLRRSSTPVAGATRTVTGEALHELLPQVDVVMLAAASVEETQQLFGAREFALMKPSAVIINIARGALIDTDALVAALRDGTIAGAGIDVTDPEPLPEGHPLFSAPNTVVTMHSADTPEMVEPLLGARIMANVRAFIEGGDFTGVVDPSLGY